MSDTNQASDTKSLLAQAVSQHGAGRLDVAEHLYRAVLAVDAADAEACHGLGALLVERGLSEPGLELLRRAVELAPDKAVYWCGLALALLAALRPDEALRVVDRAENLGLELPSARELRTQIQAAISPRGDPGDAAAAAAAVVSRQAREMVAALADAGRLEEAEAAARGLTERHPSDAFGWKALGTIMTQRHCHDAALSVLRRAVALDAGDAESLNSLATALQRVGRLDEAHAFAERAVALRPDYAEAHYNAALILHEQRRFEEALRGYRLAVEIRPNLALAHNNMGNLLTEMGRRDEALSCFSRALAVAPEYADAHNNLGSCLMGLGRTEESLACFAHALAIEPGHAEAHNNQGNALAAIGRVEEALGCYARAVAARPSYAQAYSNAGNALVSLERLEQAVDCYRRAIALAPDFALAHYNLGNTLRDLDQLGEAVEHYRRALSLQPSSADCLSNLGGVLQDLGEVDEAIACRRQALALEPDDVVAYGGLLFTLNYHPDKSAEEIFAAYRDYERRFGAPLRTGWRGHGNDRDPERRLRLGYVSADLRAHSLRSFLEPLLAHHDHGALELIAYAELARGDGVTERYRGWFDHWVDTRGLSDAALAERIRADAVDILIDLGGHTANNRLGVFARKPAPVSVSWMGYGYTTGLSAIDYFLSDAIMAPAGSEHLFAEQVWRLSAPAGVYRPRAGMGEVSALPALERGYVTFGTLSRGVRINHRVVRAWSALLARLPGSRLVVDSRSFRDPTAQRGLRERFAAHGIGPERLEIGYHSPPWEVLRGLDIGLDCFPHNSGTTLLESLYLGVPFITLAGRPSVGRAGATVLHGVGHPEWVADSEEQYVDKALDLASDLGRLASIRAGLRDALESGPWCDEAGFARRVEQAYREMWRKWCAEDSKRRGA